MCALRKPFTEVHTAAISNYNNPPFLIKAIIILQWPFSNLQLPSAVLLLLRHATAKQ